MCSSDLLPAGQLQEMDRKPQMNWPSSDADAEWIRLNEDLSKLLEMIKGPVEGKMVQAGAIIYNYCKERF